MHHEKFISRRSRNLGLSHSHARKLGRYFQHQIDHQGLPGAISFFKRCGDCIVYGLTNTGSKPSFVGTRFKYPKELTFLRQYSEVTQLRIAKMARAMKYSELRPEQVQKTVPAVLDPYKGTERGLERLTELIKLGTPSQHSLIPVRVKESYPLVGRQFRRVMSRSGPTPITMEPPIRESIELLFGTVFEDLPSVQWMFLPLSVSKYSSEDRNVPDVVGEIHATQEQGGKLRMYASPYTAFQLALTPLHEALKSFRSTLVTDCTNDQDKGALWAQNVLSTGEEVASVDLSSATCRFPLEPQIQMLRDLGIPDPWITALMAMCRGRYKVSDKLRSGKNPFPEFLQWVVGQPLGIRPSMSMFSTAHNLLLAGLCKEKGLDPKDSYRVLGDDVVMRKALYECYIQVMADAGVPISWNKTHVSSTFAEFAGYSITPTTLVRPGQWKVADSKNLIELAKWLGSPMKGEVSDMQLEIQKLILFRLGHYSPEPPEWNKFLRVNSQLNDKSVELKPPIGTLSWSAGFRACCMSQLGQCKFYPGFDPSPLDVYKPVKGKVPEWKYANYQDLAIMSDWFTTDDCLVHCYMLLEDCFHANEISFHDFANLYEKVHVAAISQHWMPPKIDNGRLSGSYIRRLETLLVSA